jgi:SAM-dependent methyltransferase
MHPEAYAFIQKHAPKKTEGLRVLEIGSYNVNGTTRPLFRGARYVGLDRRPGREVNVVADGAEWDGDGKPFDVVVSTEALEHAPDPGAVLRNARKLLTMGGRLMLTAASLEREPHGQDGVHTVPKGEHYANIDPEWLRSLLSGRGWELVTFEHHPERGDVYAVARKVSTSKPKDGTP